MVKLHECTLYLVESGFSSVTTDVATNVTKELVAVTECWPRTDFGMYTMVFNRYYILTTNYSQVLHTTHKGKIA